MNKKYLICLFIILIIACGIFGFSYVKNNLNKDTNQPIPPSNEGIIENENTQNTEVSGEYIIEQKNDSYEAMLEESESKDFATLFIQTNIFENSKKLKIKYNSNKLLLNTANPLLEGIEIGKVDENGFKSFEVDINPLKNYNIIFIKKASNDMITKEDVILSEI